jgi:hypothetical protein
MQVHDSAASAAIRDGYAAWVAAHDTLSAEDRRAVAAHIRTLGARPVVSLLLPLGFGQRGGAKASIDSVRAQLYPGWELLAAGRADADSDAVSVAASADRRVRWVAPRPCAELADAVNAALAEAQGSFAAILLPGDRLPPHALYEIAVALGTAPATDLLYTDEDRISADGRRAAPWFKTGWDPELILATDGIGSLAVWRCAVLRDAGGLRAGFGGAAPHDLALRATAALPPEHITHLPAVLCHRPLDTDGTMRGSDVAAARRAVGERLGTTAVIEPAPLWPEANRVRWMLPDPPPLVSVILPLRGPAELSAACIRGILDRTDYPGLELLVAADDRSKPALAGVPADPRVRSLHVAGEAGAAARANHAGATAQGDVLVMLDDGIDIIDPAWLRELAAQAWRPDVGAAGAKLLDRDGSVRQGGIVFGPDGGAIPLRGGSGRIDPGYAGQFAVTRGLLAVGAAGMALRRAVFEEAGGFNISRFPHACADFDLCLRLGERGYRIVWTPFAELSRLPAAAWTETAAQRALAVRDAAHFATDWPHLRAGDPFHNSNLSLPHLCAPRRRKPWRMEGVTWTH